MGVLSAIESLLTTGSVRHSDLNSLRKNWCTDSGYIDGRIKRIIFNACVHMCILVFTVLLTPYLVLKTRFQVNLLACEAYSKVK